MLTRRGSLAGSVTATGHDLDRPDRCLLGAGVDGLAANFDENGRVGVRTRQEHRASHPPSHRPSRPAESSASVKQPSDHQAHLIRYYRRREAP